MKSDFKLYLPRRPGPFFKTIIITSIVIMLFIIYGNSPGKNFYDSFSFYVLSLDSIQLHDLSIVPSLPNIFDPAVLMRAKPAKITDLMGDSPEVLIRENVTTILEHRVFFRYILKIL